MTQLDVDRALCSTSDFRINAVIAVKSSILPIESDGRRAESRHNSKHLDSAAYRAKKARF